MAEQTFLIGLRSGKDAGVTMTLSVPSLSTSLSTCWCAFGHYPEIRQDIFNNYETDIMYTLKQHKLNRKCLNNVCYIY